MTDNLMASNATQTRSGAVFSAWTGAMNFALLLLRAVELESDDQEDREDSDDDSNDVDDEWPPKPIDEIDEQWPPPDPMNEVDDLPPAPPTRKRRASPTFDDVVAAVRSRYRGKKDIAARPSTIERHVRSAEPIHIPSFNAATLPVALGAYAAKTEDKGEKYGRTKRHSVAGLIGLGFQLIRWNGINPHPLVDSEGRTFLVLAGQPDDAQYPRRPMRKHRRGLFAAINVGLTFGKGQTAPTWLDNKTYTGMAHRLLGNPDIARMANFASGNRISIMGASTLYPLPRPQHQIGERIPPSPTTLPKSVFSCASFNFGTNVWTFKHRDVCNLPFGWCAVQSLGNFDAQAGGHLVLWDLKLVVEFPAGALILLPSATIAHLQYPSGGLFRFVDAGLRTQAELAAEDPGEYERLRERRESRWVEGLSLFSTVEELSSVAVEELQSVAV
ncbi:hypothetical protein B0H14DRAFT_3452402 [Mycena olivaceomarginata]|nr:hypothetical protein B0H14DRAFT_3452402 [Mycena olivaceomarginata]